ncbi:MAG TPA: ARMT1-like domain-containing protein [Nitrospinota bacterium]|nr:ARMT1-like domain-containing protein [Nitrospinota bacterium]
MKTYLECIPCFFKQALIASQIAGADEVTQKKVLDKLSQMIPDFSLEQKPPEMGKDIYALVRDVTGNPDPFKEIKYRFNKIALNLYPNLKKKVKESKDPLLTAIRLSIAGNVIDYGTPNSFNVDDEIDDTLKKDFAIFDYEKFKNSLTSTSQILYLADNAGEVVFDKILIEELNKEIIYVVRDEPIINDALIEDALFCEMDKVAKIISSGSDAPGTILEYCSKDFLEIYKNSKFVISKGQGNFEALSEETKPIFFLFKTKCYCSAKDVGCNIGDIILKSAL